MVSQCLVFTLCKFSAKQVTQLPGATPDQSLCLSMSSFLASSFFYGPTAYNSNGCNYLPGFLLGFGLWRHYG